LRFSQTVNKILLPLKGYLLTSLALILISPLSASSAEIAIFKSQDLRPYNDSAKAFARQIGGKIDTYDMEGDMEKGKQIAHSIVASHPRLIVAIGTKASIAASDATSSIPIISLLVSRPEIYLHGKKNVAGISLNPDPREQFHLLRQLYPAIGTIGVVYDANNRSQELKDGRKAAAGNYELIEETVSSEPETPAAIRKALEEAEALWLVMDEKVITEQSLRYIITVSVEQRRPVIGFSKSMVKSGALFSIYTEFDDIGEQGAEMAKRILAGEDAETISFAYPRPSGYALNLRAAKLIGLSVPASVIKKAGEVYE